MGPTSLILTGKPIEHELLDDKATRTTRWRARQFYADVGDTRPPPKRVAAEWRDKR
jgi:hypothetical protein